MVRARGERVRGLRSPVPVPGRFDRGRGNTWTTGDGAGTGIPGYIYF